jgi:hypothetical protein
MITLAIDPSGNYDSGRGHTGIAGMSNDDWCTVFSECINAKDYDSRYEYWSAIVAYIERIAVTEGHKLQVVIESYVTRMDGFTVGKMPETAMLIGVIIFFCEKHGIPFYFQQPSQAKTRFKDDQLPKYIFGLILKDTGRYYLRGKLINDHARDAMKHLLYFKRYKEYKL